METFRGLKLAYEVGRKGGSMPTVFNAANEKAVAKFLNKEIGYLDIIEMIEYAIKEHQWMENPSVEDILRIEQEVYQLLENYKC